ncbi:hypothetical protein [Geotalea uraniireducens]|uniref:Uncharacterized protein n=1 Tax=Geotalea uraniireducens (strain Rf4) TaxID=351605 RepID=A5G5Y5_GEOUR|nr:hypothetical protein [Geotalea uraniireducens]ABQ27203.1 hypothetical protein Gura_3031 [Geotalea uraniireducens Rf4]
MKKISVYLLLMFALGIMAGCGTGASTANNATGTVSLQIDLATLQHNASSAAKIAFSTMTTSTNTITAVSATLSRDGYTDIVTDLSVANNVASGTVTGLAKGYWRVTANAYNGQALIYTGSVDVNVVAGAQVAAEILFDPASAVVDPATTGSVSLSVGFNKLPGYSKIRQFVSTILQDKVNKKFYIFDSSAGVLAVYADTLVREKDIPLQASPQALAVETAGGSLLLGYSTGKIYRLNIADESLTLLADSLISINALVPVSSKFVLVGNGTGWGPSNTYETINLENGQIVTSKSYWYPLSNFTFNQATGMAYALDSGLSPADMHHLAINASTGTIDSIGDSRYHGDYGFGAPIRVMNSDTRIATGSGNMFISSPAAADDITYAGNLGHTFIDLVSDDDLGNLYMLNSDNIKKLLVIKQDTLFTTMSIDIVAEPKQVFNTPNSIIVFIKSDSDYYAKVFSKTSLGLM